MTLISTTLVEKNLDGNYYLRSIGQRTIANYNLKGMITSHSSSERETFEKELSPHTPSERETSEKGITTSHTVGEGTIGRISPHTHRRSGKHLEKGLLPHTPLEREP